MSLPDLTWQIVYGRLAWAVVAAGLLACLWPAAVSHPRRARLTLAATIALMALPDSLSPAHWLGMAFQYPSALLLGCCILKLTSHSGARAAREFMPPALMAAVATAGAFLYMDAAGLLSVGFYQAGFGPAAAPALALLGTAVCVAAMALGRGGDTPFLVLVALLAFTLLRLPTGNLWDALIDPLLWAYAVASLAKAGVRALRQAYRERAQPVPSGELSPELPALRPAMAERYLDNEGAPSVNQ